MKTVENSDLFLNLPGNKPNPKNTKMKKALVFIVFATLLLAVNTVSSKTILSPLFSESFQIKNTNKDFSFSELKSAVIGIKTQKGNATNQNNMLEITAGGADI